MNQTGSNCLAEIDTLNVYSTGNCNLACTYCFLKKTKNRENLPDNILESTLDWFLSLPGKKKRIIFAGREPLLVFGQLIRATTYAERLAKANRKQLRLALTTNGTLLDQKKIDFLKTHNFKIRISVDGQADKHNKNRQGLNNNWQKIIDNLQKNNLGNLKISAAMVFAPAEIDRLLSDIKYLNSLRLFHSLDFFPDLYSRWDDVSVNKLKTFFLEFIRFYHSALADVKTAFQLDLINGIVNQSLFKNKFCRAVTLDWTGKLYLCDKALGATADWQKKCQLKNQASWQRLAEDYEQKKNQIETQINNVSRLDCASCPYEKICFCRYGYFLTATDKTKLTEKDWRYFCLTAKIQLKSLKTLIHSLENNSNFKNYYHRN